MVVHLIAYVIVYCVVCLIYYLSMACNLRIAKQASIKIHSMHDAA